MCVCMCVCVYMGIWVGMCVCAVPGLQGDRLYEQRLRPELVGTRAGWRGPAEDRENMIGAERSCDQILVIPFVIIMQTFMCFLCVYIYLCVWGGGGGGGRWCVCHHHIQIHYHFPQIIISTSHPPFISFFIIFHFYLFYEH